MRWTCTTINLTLGEFLHNGLLEANDEVRVVLNRDLITNDYIQLRDEYR